MLITIHNLPFSTRYVDVKSMLQEKCGLTELILDNLVSEGNTKKVTVGLADEGDAAILVRKINGLYINGLQLYVEDKRKKKDSDQPYRSSASLVQDATYQEPVAPQNPMGDMASNNGMMMNYNMAGMYMPMQMMPMDQNMAYMGYSGFMPMSPAEPRPPAPVNERGFGGFQGDSGAPVGLPRDPPRDARPRDWERRASPERPAEGFNRPSRWNDSNEVPPRRREPSPPRQQWPARAAPPERARNFDQLQPRPEYRRTDPEWQPRPSRWDADPGAEPRWEPEPGPEPRWEPEPGPEPRWEPEPDPEPRWEPEPDRAWEPEPERTWDEPTHVMENDNRRFNTREGDYRPGPEGNYPRPERFDPNDRHFDAGHPPVRHEPEFRGRPRDLSGGRDRRNRHDHDWNAGNDRNNPSREEQAWARREEPHRPSRPSRPDTRDQPPSTSNRNEWHEDQRPNPPKRPLPDRQRGPADWNQIANNYPPSKKSRENSDKRPTEPRHNSFTPRPANPQNIPTQKRKERPPLTQSTLLGHKPNKVTHIINKDLTKRGQATARLSKQTMNQSKKTGGELYPAILKELKICIRSRIDVMLGEELVSEAEDIVHRYRKKYPVKDDKELYNCMKDKVTQQMAQEGTGTVTGANTAAVVKTEKTDTPEDGRIPALQSLDRTCRGQATARLARQALYHEKGGQLHPAVFDELKKCIRSRIDVMLGEELARFGDDVMSRYRQKYPFEDDKELLQCTKDKVTQQMAQAAMEMATGANTAAVVKTEKTDTQVNVKLEPENAEEPEVNEEKLPRSAMTDKQIIREEKQLRKVEFSKKDHYKLDALTDQFVEEELAKLTDIFSSECANPADHVEKVICNRITKNSVDEFVTTGRLHLAKRILDIRTGLAVRIFANDHKLPRRVFIKEYLKPYKIERLVLKKNKKGTMYVANLGSFEHYDHLCHLQNDVIADTPVTIRSMYLVGPPPKLSKNQIKMRRQQFISSQVEPKGEYIVPANSENQSENKKTESEIEPTAPPLKPDTVHNLNAGSMEDFTADDFDAIDFADDNFADDPNAEDDPEGLNIDDMKDEDLEDF